jgi:DNA-directed RNA polymerase
MKTGKNMEKNNIEEPVVDESVENSSNGVGESNNSVGNPETVEVPVSQLQTILNQMEKQSAEIEALKSIQSQTRLQEAEEKLNRDNRPRVHFKLLDGKPVVGWPDSVGPEKKNEIIFNPNSNTPMGEVLKCVYYFADGTKTELIDQIRFIRATEVAYARVLQDEGDYGLLEFEDKSIYPGTIRVHKRFWNA